MARGRKISWIETRKKYKQRISQFSSTLWNSLSNAYIGTFELYSTVEDIEEDSHMDCFAGVILRTAREKGIMVKGVTSERKSNGAFICPLLLNDEDRNSQTVVYVGKYSYFSNHDKSPWAPTSADYVYE